MSEGPSDGRARGGREERAAGGKGEGKQSSISTVNPMSDRASHGEVSDGADDLPLMLSEVLLLPWLDERGCPVMCV